MLQAEGQRFWVGCLSGFSIAAGLVLAFFAFDFSQLRDTLAEFGGEVPTITRLVTNPAYLFAMPVGVLAVVVLGNLWVKKTRALFTLTATVAVVALVAVVVGYWGATLPMRQLGTNISAE